jgi:midasin (ATPase involved in ribosome maturation)
VCLLCVSCRCQDDAVEGVLLDHSQILADDGYMLLAERVRHDTERQVVRSCIEKHLKVKINVETL